MDKSILLQQKVRNNFEDLQSTVLELKEWEKEMKRKDAELRSSQEEILPPIRRKQIKVSKSNTQKCINTSTERIKSSDYSKWDKFDVEKACDEIDMEKEIEEVEEEMTPEELERLHDEANALKVKGNLHVKKQEWKKAIDYYTEAMKIFNFDATFYANRALCFLKVQNLYSAEADCTVAIQLDENYVKAYHRRALARMELKQYREAKQDIEKLLQLEPSNKEGKSMLMRLNQAIKNQKGVIISETQNDNTTSIEKKIGEKLVKKNTESLKKKEENKGSKIEKIKNAESLDIKTEQTKMIKNKNLPPWVPDLDDIYEIVEPITKPAHQRQQKPMKKVLIEEINLGSSALSKSTEQLETEIRKQQKESQTVKCVDDKTNTKDQKNDRILIEVINEDMEIPPPPKTSVQFFSNWNKLNSVTLRYEYLKQISPESLPSLFKVLLEIDVLSEILQVLYKEFMKRNQPVYQYLKNLSNVRRFRALALFFSAQDKDVVNKLLEYVKSTENKSNEDITQLRDKYEI